MEEGNIIMIYTNHGHQCLRGMVVVTATTPCRTVAVSTLPRFTVCAVWCLDELSVVVVSIYSCQYRSRPCPSDDLHFVHRNSARVMICISSTEIRPSKQYQYFSLLDMDEYQCRFVAVS
jgi:hypothetical protein